MILSWAWSASKYVDSRLRMRLKFLVATIMEPELSRSFSSAPPCSPLGQTLADSPQIVGLLLWPYQCISWEAKERFDRVSDHIQAAEAIGGLRLAPNEKIVLADLASFSPGLSLMLDRAPWLEREGLLTLSIFKGDFRAFTVSFSLSGHPDTEIFIGGLQGRQSDDALALYRDLTKDLAGIRPRDFILEMLRLVALKIGVQRIHAVADDHKISRHKYFGSKPVPGLFYDDVWQERGGNRVAASHFRLPLEGTRRPLEEVPTKKRSMYRRRYEMLDQIEVMLPTDLVQAERRIFEAK